MTAEFGGKKIVITGGAGFIGSHLVDALVEAGAARVAVVDTFFLGKEGNLESAHRKAGDALRVYREDAAEAEAVGAVVRAEEPDVVFNLATKALLYSFFNPAGACRVNLDIALNLCELQRGGAFGRLVHFSTSEVYGTARTVPMTEDHPFLAETTYAAGKAAADQAIASYVRMFGLDILTVRPFNNYGPRQNDGALAAVVPLTIRRLREGGRPVIQGDGRQTRDFIYVGDTVAATLKLAAMEDMAGRVLNVASGHETAIADIIQTLCRLMDYDGPIDHAPERVADVRRHCADVGAAEALIGPIAVTSLEEGLRRTVEGSLAGPPA